MNEKDTLSIEIDKSKLILEHLKELQGVSDSMTTWALSVLAGSIIVIISTSYIRPSKVKFRLPYLLFVPAWIFTIISIYQGSLIPRKVSLAVQFSDKIEHLLKIKNSSHDDLGGQMLFFNIVIVIFGVWLTYYLIWWIFSNEVLTKKKN